MATKRTAFSTVGDIESASGGADDHGITVDEKHPASADVKSEKAGHDFALSTGADLPSYEADARKRLGETLSDDVGTGVVATAEDLVTRVIDLEDDPTQNPWTFRVFFLGIGLSTFGAVLQEIFYFKPQTIYVSVIFLTVLAYILGEAMSYAIPRKGAIGRFLNPFPFHMKEHASITLMASAASQSALATEALAAQELFYGGYPNKAAGIFIVITSQLIGFGLAGLLREVLVYPTHMLWPMNLPITSLLESLHGDKTIAKQRLKLFYIIFFFFLVWEIFPEYIFTVLEGVSIFCLAKQDSLVFTNLFGGASGNEGMGLLALSFDWNYIAPFGSPLWLPLQTLVNEYIGYMGCIVFFMGLYYSNTYRSQDFPFLAQALFNSSSNGTVYQVYDQTTILNDKFEIDPALVAQQGTPWLTGSYLGYLITSNMGFTATFVHMLLWNFDDIKSGWSWAKPANLKKLLRADTWKFWVPKETPEERFDRKANDPKLDPHYKLMLSNLYQEVPLWWWGAVLVICWAVGLGCLYALKSTLPWWGFLVSTIMLTVFLLFFGAQYGITGFQYNIQPICQTLAGYMFPGRPLANMYFTCFTYNSMQQAQLLARDLKLAQYVHLPPRHTFTIQVIGCVVGAILNWVMMLTIVQNQAPILTGIVGSNIWSGQNVQQFNTLAISWSMASDMYSIGAKYEWVTIAYLLGFLAPFPLWIANKIYPHKAFRYLNTSIILWQMGYLFVGINAAITMFFGLGFIAQWYLRRKYPSFFVKYNYITSAALDGGTQVMVFILTFAVFGGSGTTRPFPIWAGNPDSSLHNLDYCMVNTAETV
ncbi:uncharacterized protein SPSK_08583 [Sporothrix schenckii 1099-18]|uniref:OPT superfamily oligopeptide transporter n=1 Tax=Sporothrix schenckii 1099-18 TaxID=1397361 RepID=A0A0F2M8C7_SPOSC|nr:uncharacterized protein SPSK_08583 [Sporothrix schenckii 1099-18]KJR85349.1 hypothetical protein SPSK_08583 [Sporothrix schenckii 1099-18]